MYVPQAPLCIEKHIITNTSCSCKTGHQMAEKRHICGFLTDSVYHWMKVGSGILMLVHQLAKRVEISETHK